MADAKEKDEVLAPNANPETDAAEKVLTLANISSASNAKGIVSGKTDKMEEAVGVNDEGKAIVEAIAEEELDEEDALSEDEINGEDEEKAEEKKNGKEVEESSKGKGRKPRKRNKKKKAAQKASETVTADGNKTESSKKKKASKRVESMGMVFMCSSETKADCFRYKILGLPANKKDQVAKIYKGMRLFLFDVDLRLMYGIFKAAGPGGYNIEPKAFKSAFPSQVRFTVFEDCLPLAEENFKKVIKENYYTRNKFECQLNAEQVKKLCKLFVVPGKGGPSLKPAITNRMSRADENHRSRADDSRSRADAYTSRDREKRKRRAWEEERRPHSPPLARERKRYHDYERAPVRYEREVLASPIDPSPRYVPLPSLAAAPPLRSFGYERALEIHPYVREPVLEHRTYRVLDTEPRRHGEIVSHDRDRDRDRDRDPYLLYRREPPSYRDSLYPSLGETAEYHHPPAASLPHEYRLVSREYHPSGSSAVQPAEYRLSGGLQVPDYRNVGLTTGYPSSSASLPEYRSHRTHYRY